MYFFLMFSCACLLRLTSSQPGDCVDAAAMANYTTDLFDGVWYDVAKIQTPLGALTVRRCFCNYVERIYENTSNGDSDISLVCNLDATDGQLSNLTGELRAMRTPGKWDEYTIAELPGFPITWTNIYLDDDVGITYDCGRAATTVEYCIHFVSRTRTIDDDVLRQLIEYAESLGLNPRGIEMEYVDQDGCAPVADS